MKNILSTNDINKLNELISKDKLEKAIEYASNLTTDANFLNQFLNLSGRIKFLQKKSLQGAITEDFIFAERAKIRLSLLQLIGSSDLFENVKLERLTDEAESKLQGDFNNINIQDINSVNAPINIQIIKNQDKEKKLKTNLLFWIIVTIILLISSYTIYYIFFAYPIYMPAESFNIVPENKNVTSVHDFFEPSYDAFEMFSERKTLDLRGWKKLSSIDFHRKKSPVTLTRVIKLKKKIEVSEIRFQSSTTGLGISFSCELPYRIEERAPEPTTTKKRIQKTYHVIVDISSFPINKEFSIKIQSTYWNAFQGINNSYFVIKPHDNFAKISLTALFPTQKDISIKDYSLDVKHRGENRNRWHENEKEGFTIIDTDNSIIYWELIKPKIKSLYILDWTW